MYRSLFVLHNKCYHLPNNWGNLVLQKTFLLACIVVPYTLSEEHPHTFRSQQRRWANVNWTVRTKINQKTKRKMTRISLPSATMIHCTDVYFFCLMCQYTFMFYSWYREVLSSLPQNFACLCISKIHPVSARKRLCDNNRIYKINSLENPNPIWYKRILGEK